MDTQVIVLAYLGEELPKKVRSLLLDPEIDRLVSAISLVEIAIKNTSGRIEITTGDLNKAIKDLALSVIPFTARHALKMFSLPPHHRDPFDRMIIATAIAENLTLLGADRQFGRYAGLKSVW